MSDNREDHRSEPSHDDIRSAKRGWTVVALTFAAMFGAAYVMAEI